MVKAIKSEPRWQKEIKEKKQKRSFVVVRLWLILIIVVILFGVGFKTYRTFKNSIWSGKDRINFVLKGEETILASFKPEESLTLIPIPKGTYLEVTHGYGKYRVEAISSLGEIEKRENLLKETIQENLGVPVEGWINIVNSKLKIVNSKETLLNKLGEQIRSVGKTNFSPWDLIRLWWKIRKVKGGEVEVVDLAKLNVFSEIKLADGTTVFEPDPARLDPVMQKFLPDFALKKENLSIEVLNGTLHPGLAEKGARLLTNIGGEVVAVGNSEEASQKSKVKSPKSKRNSYTISKIKRIFTAEWEEKKEEGRAEITVILGEDYWQKLRQK